MDEIQANAFNVDTVKRLMSMTYDLGGAAHQFNCMQDRSSASCLINTIETFRRIVPDNLTKYMQTMKTFSDYEIKAREILESSETER